ncbi:helix-turn-helix transcriptional regulator [bacterium]|nr:helix-turn-helix transcriptional regulator [bacterium]
MVDIKKRLARNVKKLRRSRGLSQEELSLNLDLDGSYIGKVENAKLNITIDKMAKIAEFFNVSVVDLLK